MCSRLNTGITANHARLRKSDYVLIISKHHHHHHHHPNITSSLGNTFSDASSLFRFLHYGSKKNNKPKHARQIARYTSYSGAIHCRRAFAKEKKQNAREKLDTGDSMYTPRPDLLSGYSAWRTRFPRGIRTHSHTIPISGFDSIASFFCCCFLFPFYFFLFCFPRTALHS